MQRISLTCQTRRPGDLPTGHRWLGALSLGLLLAGCGEDPAPPGDFEGPRNVLLISLDTLRADACSLYGYEKPTTPFLEELSQRGVVFERHMVNSNNTLTSHATIFTGLLMMTHEADHVTEAALAPEHETVAEAFQAGGFETAAFASHEQWISRGYGLDQGFEEFDSRWSNDAPTINASFLAWIQREKPRRFFAFLHYYDAHSELEGQQPYVAPPEYLERFAGAAPQGFDPSLANPADPEAPRLRLASYLNYYQPADRWMPEGYAEYMRGCYDAGVAKLDADLRDLFGELERMGVLDDALVIITSDHGEEFEDHGGVLHNGYHDEIMHVPLLIIPPKGTPIPTPRVRSISRAVDLADTLLDLAGLPALDTSQGKSLRPLLEDQEVPYAKTFFGRIVLRDQDEFGEFKVAGISGTPRFYDLDADPGELTNIVDELRVNNRERLEDSYARIMQARRECDLVRIKVGAERSDAPPPNAKQLAELEALGYVGAEEELEALKNPGGE